MSNNLSPSTKALLQAAKGDRPSTERRAAMWTGITGGLVTHTPLHVTPQGAPPPTAAPAAAATKGALFAGASMKGAFIGALFGSAISIGVATFMLRSKPAEQTPPPAVVTTVAQPSAMQPAPAQPNDVAATANAQIAPSNLELAATPNDARSTENSAVSSRANASQPVAHGTSSAKSTHAKKDTSSSSLDSPDDMLMREVALVADARRQLLTGDPASALKSVRAARSLEARQMEPEEMGLEAKALRALGRDAEADKVESQLRSMYPGASMH